MYTYRENNKCVDFLANLGCVQRKQMGFTDVALFPQMLRGLCRMDRMGILNLRCKKWQSSCIDFALIKF